MTKQEAKERIIGHKFIIFTEAEFNLVKKCLSKLDLWTDDYTYHWCGGQTVRFIYVNDDYTTRGSEDCTYIENLLDPMPLKDLEFYTGDIQERKSFTAKDLVLVRDNDTTRWYPQIFLACDEEKDKYVCANGWGYKEENIVPFVGNEKLLFNHE